MRTNGSHLDRYRREHPVRGDSPLGSMYGHFRIGRLRVIAAASPMSESDSWWPWEHVSVSVVDSKLPPEWAEMCAVKDLFWREDETVVQFHPPKADYINHHPGVLHLWRRVDAEYAAPAKAKEMV